MPSNIRPRLAVLGARGLLGLKLVRHFASENEVAAIDKENYDTFRGQKFDILINANGNSRRYWANQNPELDFEASTVSVEKSFADFSTAKYVYICSSDVYPDHSTPATTLETQEILKDQLSSYGLHKYLAEEIVRQSAKNLIFPRRKSPQP